MAAPLELDLTDVQKFEQERLLRTIAATKDIEALRNMASTLVRGFMVQRAAAQWALRQSFQPPIRDYTPATMPGISDPAPEAG